MDMPHRRLWLVLACGLMVAACSAGETASTDGGTGGTSATGGTTASGGASATGGVSATGGATESGGSKGSGGGTATGGSPGDAGRGGTAGAAGQAGTGGVPGSGGGGSGAGGGQGGRASAAGGAGGRTGPGGSGGSTGGRGGTAGSAGSAGHGGGGSAGAGGLGPQAPGRVTGYGTVLVSARASYQMIRLQTTMLVPPEPPATGTLFLWPGLQPNGANFDPINNGVLQPVLTWGPSCAPGKQPRAYSTWWISGQYVNTFGKEPGYTGCQGGPIISVDVGDTLNIDMVLAGTIWTQTVTDVQTGESAAYSIDMKSQAQNLAYFIIEEYSAKPVSDVVFTDTVITFGSPDAADCKLTMRGQNDFVSVPVASADGRSCSIQNITLRAEGVP